MPWCKQPHQWLSLVINVKKDYLNYAQMYMFSWLQGLCIWSINPVLYIHWVNMQLRLITNAVLWNMQLFDKTNISTSIHTNQASLYY